MRILHVIQRYWPYVGGSERQFQEFSERLVRDGHQVTVYTTDAWDLELFWARGKKRIEVTSEEHNGVTIRRFAVRHVAPFWVAYPAIRRVMLGLSNLPVDATRLMFSLAGLTPWVPDLTRQLNSETQRFDLIAGMNIVFDALLTPALRLAERRGVPFVLHPLTHLGEEGDARVRRYYTMRHQVRLLRQSAAVVVQNELELTALGQLGVPHERMHLIGSGVNPDEILGGQAERFRARHDVAGPIVAFLGTAAFDKGAHHSVEAMTLLHERGVEATLVFAGPTMDQFTSYYARQPAGVGQRCRVLGFVSEDDKRDLLAACDMLILPSRTESFGIVFPEAWVYAKPVIGARAGGIPAVISDGEDGFLVPFGDVAALADRMQALLSDPALARRLGEAGQRKTLAELTWDRKYALVKRLYESLAGGATGG
jgi:glycosyltransferase involved in cell wall biosynthesis